MNGLGNRSWPDQFFYSKRFVAGTKGVWIEFKAPGKRPTELQYEKLKELQEVGFDATWFDNKTDAINFLKGFLK